MFGLQNNYLQDGDPLAGIPAAIDFVVRSKNHTELKATPGQLVFGCVIISNTPFIADFESIRQLKQQQIYQNENYRIKPQTAYL